jgi:hypothetical protein
VYKSKRLGNGFVEEDNDTVEGGVDTGVAGVILIFVGVVSIACARGTKGSRTDTAHTLCSPFSGPSSSLSLEEGSNSMLHTY